jgi:hypothetical protein
MAKTWLASWSLTHQQMECLKKLLLMSVRWFMTMVDRWVFASCFMFTFNNKQILMLSGMSSCFNFSESIQWLTDIQYPGALPPFMAVKNYRMEVINDSSLSQNWMCYIQNEILLLFWGIYFEIYEQSLLRIQNQQVHLQDQMLLQFVSIKSSPPPLCNHTDNFCHTSHD